ncbi:SseB protein N-terminal domain-containing protein [Malonomonas rubra DSM 5091]|uniref:SseB protein N-terminal domain-containing protein n=1 Tax=Malonomonas rubra DSM 5091 TaxID=1122189 RepID=A0A1M6DID0_MALRU|nr:SseB family protein [Malonomonas rubra]SHI73016.1 SseB protein N-terminal domain-containing protein [Malonomonas rubra DSM 5091]
MATKLDEALALGAKDPKAQPLYYDLFLNSLFFIPVIEEKTAENDETKNDVNEDDGSLPLLVQANGNEYLMLFDTIKRLQDWADDSVKYAALPGHAVTEMSLPNLYWALNYGTEHQKMFEPKEIAWLKEIVRQTKDASEEQEKQEEPNQQDTE